MSPEFDWLTLDTDEEVVYSSQPHRSSLIAALVVGIPLAVVGVGLAIIAAAYLTHKNTHYVITTDGLYKKTGILSRDVQKVEYGKVQNTSYRQGPFGSQFGYGTVDVSTAGGSGVELAFTSVPKPQRVQTLINERIKAAGGRSDDDERGKADVLDEILSELRAIRIAAETDSTNPHRSVEQGKDGPR